MPRTSQHRRVWQPAHEGRTRFGAAAAVATLCTLLAVDGLARRTANAELQLRLPARASASCTAAAVHGYTPDTKRATNAPGRDRRTDCAA